MAFTETNNKKEGNDPNKKTPSFCAFLQRLLTSGWESTIGFVTQSNSYYQDVDTGDKGNSTSSCRCGLWKSPSVRCVAITSLAAYHIWTCAAPAMVLPSASPRTWLYVSSEGLCLPLSTTLPGYWVASHTGCTALLSALAILQKESVPKMSYTRQSTEKGNDGIGYAKDARTRHGVVGGSTAMAMLGCAVTGVLLRQRSALSRPRGLLIAGALLPWCLVLPATIASAKARKAVPHAVWGDVVFKSSLAFPLARLLGRAFQSSCGATAHLVRSIRPPLFWKRAQQLGAPPKAVNAADVASLESCYMAGVLCSTVLMALWTLWDVRALLRAAREEYASEE